MAKLSINEQLARYQERKYRFTEAAKAFAAKVALLRGVQEVALCGSMVTEDPYPNDIDLAIVVDWLGEVSGIARAARQMSSIYHAWEVFVFSPDRTYLGRVCRCKECPTETGRCDNVDCGRVPHLGNLGDFSFFIPAH